MTARLTLSEKEMSEAILQYLKAQGWEPVGPVTFNHDPGFPGCQRDGPSTTASVEVAPKMGR